MTNQKKYYTYILKCNDNTFYTGKTINLEKRLKQHNGVVPGGAKYTRTRRPVTLYYFEQFKSNKEAMLREIELKKKSHKSKSELLLKDLKN